MLTHGFAYHLDHRLTFKTCRNLAGANGIILQRKGNGFEYWKMGASHTVGEAKTLKKAWEDLQNF